MQSTEERGLRQKSRFKGPVTCGSLACLGTVRKTMCLAEGGRERHWVSLAGWQGRVMHSPAHPTKGVMLSIMEDYTEDYEKQSPDMICFTL